MSATSNAAYASIKPHAPAIRKQIIEFVHHRGLAGATREEIETCVGLKSNTVNPRLRELEAKKLIVNSGRVRQQSSGRNAVIWVTPEFGPIDAADETNEEVSSDD